MIFSIKSKVHGNINITIDNMDSKLVGDYKWHLHGNKIATVVNRENIYLHRLILGANKKDVVIALDGDYFNCSKSNLLLINSNKAIDKGKYYELIINSATYGQHVVFFDKSDSDLILPYQWGVVKNKDKDTFYCQRYGGSTGSAPVLMHISLMSECEGLEIDHIDHNGLNNRRNNIRYATTTQNGYNKRTRKDNKTGYKGVFKVKKNGNYMSYITYNKKRIYLGFYKTAEEAALKYNEKAIELHGEFAYLNKINQ